jgi:peptidoglycan/LPS O-acetylase OafA/YrhL
VQTVGFTLLAILSGGLLVIGVASSPQTAAGRFLAHRFLRSLGRYSYALYVFHHPIMLYAGLVFGAGSFPTLAGSQVPGQLVFTAVTAALSLAAAVLSWHLYEAQFLKLKRLFPYDTQTKQGSAA